MDSAFRRSSIQASDIVCQDQNRKREKCSAKKGIIRYHSYDRTTLRQQIGEEFFVFPNFVKSCFPFEIWNSSFQGRKFDSKSGICRFKLV